MWNSIHSAEGNSITGSKLLSPFNTQGWNKGLGGGLLRKIEEIVGPTDVFELDPSPNGINPQHEKLHAGRLHILEAIPPSSFTVYHKAADHRTLSIFSYFHCLPYFGYLEIRTNLEERLPLEVDIAQQGNRRKAFQMEDSMVQEL